MSQPLPNNDVTIGELSRTLNTHITDEGKRSESMAKEITLIKDNHLAHLAVDVTEVKSDLGWLKKYHWIFATAGIGGFLAAIGNLVYTVNQAH